MMPALVRRAVVGMAAFALWGGPSAAQTPDPVRVSSPSWAEEIHIETRPAAPVVGVSVAFPVGSGSDANGLPGLGQVAGEAVVAEVEAQLGAGEVEGRARVTPDRTLLTFLVRPERVSALLDALGRATGSTPVSGASIETALQRRSEVLRFELDSPVAEGDQERRALLYGDGDPRVRPPGGTLTVVEGSGAAEVEAARRTLFTGSAHLAIVGAVVSADAQPMVAETPGVDSLAPGPVVVSERPVAGTTSAGPAWTAGDRRLVVRPVTNSWVTVAWPVPAELSRVAVLYLADRIHRELNASPPDPGLFNASAEVVELPAGEIILVRAAVLPDAAARFEATILDLPRTLSLARDTAFFRFNRGQFRASRLIAEAAPEAASDRMAVELLTRGVVLDFDDAVWDLTADIAADAAESLGDPRILVFGPELGR